MSSHDVIVVGAGNAAMCAALSAHEQGARVLVLERAQIAERGGNSAHSGGSFRVVYRDMEDFRTLVPDLSPAEADTADFGTYTEEQYLDDLARMSQYRCDPDLAEVLVRQSLPTATWMQKYGVRFVPIYGRQAFKVDGRFRFWGGLTVEVSGGGLGLMQTLFAAAQKAGIEVLYGARAVQLLRNHGRACGVRVIRNDLESDHLAKAVVLGSGGFHANTEWRARYLGPNWDLAKARGTRCNTGDGIRMAIDAGALSWGNWSGCHSVFYDRNAPDFGDLNLLNQQKNGFAQGIVVNALGRRFVDEGRDFRNYTYAQMGARVLEQPGAIGYQVFDSKVIDLLPDEYRIRQITRVQADTLGELAAKMDGIDPQGFLAEVQAFNAAVRTDRPYNPAIKDGRCTTGLAVNKSNWANPLDAPPYYAFGVTAGVTCTYGGIRIDTGARVLSADGPVIPGLFATGEMVGGLYYVNYPGGAGLMSGSVFGKIGGANAAAFAASR
jgi:tricarballylate dehydrogenase